MSAVVVVDMAIVFEDGEEEEAVPKIEEALIRLCFYSQTIA